MRCIDDHEWFTGAETAECAMAHAAVGEFEQGPARCSSGPSACATPTAATGPASSSRSGKTFPHLERVTYTGAAMVLADDCLFGEGPASGLFRGEGLPCGLDLDLAALAESELDRRD